MTSESSTILAIEQLHLQRYPKQPQKNSPLQAWDAADEYLLDACQHTPLQAGSCLILNDNFGALSCALYAFEPLMISDSYISQMAAQQNWHRNGLQTRPLSYCHILDAWPDKPATVLIKIPKTLALLEFQLAKLSQIVTPETTIIAAAKTTHIHTSTLALFEKWLGCTTTSLARKKARLIYCHPDGKSRPRYEPLCRWRLEETPYTIANHAGLFSRQSLDIGTRFFMAHLPINKAGTIIDLGCGNGIVGLMALQHNPTSTVIFSDESAMAVASAELNVKHNRPEDYARCQFRIDNCLSQQADQSAQIILCNPPFHQQHAMTDHIANAMFMDAKRCLTANGELYIVANRHLPYYQQLKRLFGHCQTIASNRKFMVLHAVKR